MGGKLSFTCINSYAIPTYRIMRHTLLSFIKDSSYVVIGAGLSLLCNYFFHFYVSRALGPKDYGVYNALLSFSLLLTLPFGAISLAVANETVRLEKEKISDYIRQLLFFNITFAVFLFVLLLINIKWISTFLHIDNPLLILITFLIPVISLFPSILIGVLQGLQFFKPYALVTTSVQLFRLVFGVILVILGLKVFGALLGTIFGAVAGLMLLLFFIRSYLSWPPFKRKGERIKQTIKKSLSYLGYTGAFFSLMYVDVPLVRHFFTAQETGFYSAAALLGKVPVYLIGSMGMVIFPKVVEMRKQNQAHFRFFTIALFIALVLLTIIAISYILLAKLVVKMLFGSAYIPAVPLVKHFGLSAIPLTLASVTVRYFIGIENRRFLYLVWLCALGFVVSFCLFHPMPDWAIWWLSLWSFLIIVSVFVGNLFFKD